MTTVVFTHHARERLQERYGFTTLHQKVLHHVVKRRDQGGQYQRRMNIRINQAVTVRLRLTKRYRKGGHATIVIVTAVPPIKHHSSTIGSLNTQMRQLASRHNL